VHAKEAIAVDYEDKRTSMGDKPDIPRVEESGEAVEDACANDRDTLTPRQTADCAGREVAERYEQEEDGGS
jgi:hypothetical protein